jgi:pimeloyl-ACP methyl ester carboxylesterase
LTARLFLQRYPEHVAGLVLLDPAYPDDWTPPSPALGSLVRRGARLCRYARVAARLRVTSLVAGLARAGASRSARVTAFFASRGALRRVDEEIMAPAAKLPPDVRAIAQRFWTQPKFFDALGSQIESITESAAAVPVEQQFGNVPVVVVSGEMNSDAGQLARQSRLAARSSRGRHVVAERSGHWIPLDRPDVVVAAIREVIAALG